MRKTSAVAVILLALAGALAHGQSRCDGCGTVITDSYIEGVTWTEAGSPYCIETDITVNMLTIEPGVCIRVAASRGIEVMSITAVGTVDLPIVFTATDSLASWSGLHLQDQGAGSRFIYCQFAHAGNSALRLENSTPEIRHCVFRSNYADPYGGAINATLHDGNLTLTNCELCNNGARTAGGGLYVETGPADTLVLVGCTLRDNSANPWVEWYRSPYGGALAVTGNCAMRNSVVTGNVARTIIRSGGASASGGGLYSVGGMLTLDNVYVANNLSRTDIDWFASGAYSYGGGITAGRLEARNSIIACNSTHARDIRAGAGIYLSADGGGVLENCTIARNDYEGLYTDAQTLAVTNSILYFNASNGAQFVGAVEFAYSDVQGDTTVAGVGNTTGNPNFRGLGCSPEDLTIGLGQFCVDKGNPALAFNDGCRPPALGGPRNDIGAHGGPGGCGWISPPPAPAHLKATASHSEISLTWDPVDDPYLAGYSICRSTVSAPEVSIGSVDAGTVTYADRTAAVGTRYFYRVQGFSTLHEGGAFSNEVCATRGDATHPSAPASLEAAAGMDSVFVTWTRSPECDLTSYRLYRGNPSPDELLATIPKGTESLVDRDVSVGPVYAYQVRAVDNAGNEGAGSNVAAAQLPAADLSISASVADPDPSVVESVVFSITATNNGPEPGEGVVISILQPPGVTFESFEADSGSFDWQSWSVGQMTPGEVNHLQITGIVAQAGPDTLHASITGTAPTDPVADNNHADAAFWGRMADLVLTHSVDNASPAYQDTVRFSAVLYNAGPDPARTITVRETHSPDLAVGSVTASGETTYADGLWQISSLATGARDTLVISARVEGFAPDTSRVVITSGKPYDPDPSTNSAESIVAVPVADLQLAAQASNPTPIIGREVDLVVTLANLGPGPATDIRITVEMPSGLALRSAEAQAGTYSSATGTWSIPALAADAVAILTITAGVLALPDTLRATRSGSVPADPDAGNDQAVVSLRAGLADLAVEKTVDDDSPLEVAPATFTISLTNAGPDAGYEIVVRDRLPNGLDVTDFSASPGGYDAGEGTWTIPTLPAYATGTLSLTVSANRPGLFQNQASVYDAGVSDPVSDNGADSVSVQFRPAADLAISAAALPDTARIYSSAVLSVSVANRGPSPATGIVIDAPIPVGLDLLGTETSTGTYAGGQWSIQGLMSGSSATLTLTVTSAAEGIAAIHAWVSVSAAADQDLANNSATASLCFFAPPTIEVEMPAMADDGSEVAIRATITDNTGVASARLHYRRAMESAYASTAMVSGGGATYQATIPGGSVHAEGLVCRVTATDLDGNSSDSEDFPVVVQTGGRTNQTAQPCGLTQATYRLVSVPLVLDDSSVEEVLVDDLGPYGPSNWRFFELEEDQSYSEYPDVGPMTPGRAFWLAVAECDRVIDTGPGHCTRADSLFALPLHARWNLVADPFLFSIPLQRISMESGAAIDMMRFGGSWEDLNVQGEVLVPFSGYLAWVDEPDGDRMLFDPNPTSGMKSAAAAADQSDWSVRILADIGSASDYENAIAVNGSASADLDPLDRPEPPVIGEFVSVYFDHPEWGGLTERYRSDVRPKPGDGSTWELTVRSNIPDQVTLRFQQLDQVPAEYTVVLIDPVLDLWQDLRKVATYRYLNYGDERPRVLQLLVGRADYVDEARDLRIEEPSGFTIRSFPNPFGGMTTLHFGLPAEERVTLRVVDVSGALVTTLLNGERIGPGFHAVIWDGRNSRGHPVGSGLYSYQLRTERRSVRGQLMLIR